MSHDPEKAEGAQVIDIDGDDRFEVVASGDRYVVGRRGDRHEIWDARERTVVGTFEGVRGRRNAWLEFKALEGRQHERRKRAKARWSVVVGLSLAIILVAGTTLAVYLNRSSAPATRSIPAVGTATNHVENPEGGYAFRAPGGWTDLQDGASTQVASPDGDVTISVDLAGVGDPAAAATTRADSLTVDWPEVSLEAPQQRMVGGAPAVSVGGTGTTVAGDRYRFVAIGVQTPAGAYTIAITIRMTADLSRTTPAIDGILSSFRAPTA
jgi:hypothetical protein